jgi:hypothetical protein
MQPRRFERTAVARCFLNGCVAAAVFATCALIQPLHAHTARVVIVEKMCPVARWWHPVPSLRLALTEHRANVIGDAAGILYRRVSFTGWCGYPDRYW